MAYAAKIERTGLAGMINPASPGAPNITIRDSNRNGSVSKYQPQGRCGDFVATEIYGKDASPSESFAVMKSFSTTAGQVYLGKVTTVNEDGNDTCSYGLESFNISTGAASVPTISASAKLLESGASDASQSKYKIPAFTLSTSQCAQDIFGAFTLGGTGCNLTNCAAAISCSLNTDKLVGVPVSSDCNSGIITVSGQILRVAAVTGNTAPTITANPNSIDLGNGNTGKWEITKDPTPTENNPETSYQIYTFELQLRLVKSSPDIFEVSNINSTGSQSLSFVVDSSGSFNVIGAGLTGATVAVKPGGGSYSTATIDPTSTAALLKASTSVTLTPGDTCTIKVTSAGGTVFERVCPILSE